MSQLATIKRQFFDRIKVTTALDKKTLKILNRFGATVRKTAQYSMRTKKGPSAPGKPPHSHDRKLLRKLLFYSLDTSGKSVVVGPVLKESSARVMIPRLHEKGGYTVSKDGIRRKYEKRAYMKPAFDVHVGKVAQAYRGL